MRHELLVSNGLAEDHFCNLVKVAAQQRDRLEPAEPDACPADDRGREPIAVARSGVPFHPPRTPRIFEVETYQPASHEETGARCGESPRRFAMGNVNRKAYASEKQHTQQVIAEAFPHLIAVFGGHGGGRTPRDHTISFHLRDAEGRLRSNVMWVLPEFLNRLTVKDVRAMVARANGRWDSKRRRARSKAAPRSI